MNGLLNTLIEEKKIGSEYDYDTEYHLKAPFDIIIPVLLFVYVLYFGFNIINNKNKKAKIIISVILIPMILFMAYLMIYTSGFVSIHTSIAI